MSCGHNSRRGCRGQLPVINDSKNLLIADCEVIEGGTKTVGVPKYVLKVTNPNSPAGCLWEDEDLTRITEDNGDPICLDNV